MKFKKLFAGVAAAATLLAGMAFGTGAANAAETTVDTAATVTFKASKKEQLTSAQLRAYKIADYVNYGTAENPVYGVKTAAGADRAKLAAALTTAGFQNVPTDGTTDLMAWAMNQKKTTDTDGTVTQVQFDQSETRPWNNPSVTRKFADALQAGNPFTATADPFVLNKATGSDTDGWTATNKTALTAGVYLFLDGNASTDTLTQAVPMIVSTGSVNAEGVLSLGDSTAEVDMKSTVSGTQTKSTTSKSASVGETVPFELGYTIPNPVPTGFTLQFKDVPSKGLTVDFANLTVKAGVEVLTGTDYTVENNLTANKGNGKKVGYFEKKTTPKLLENHKAALTDMITRDKNHASVIAWSILNEPQCTSEGTEAYFKPLFDLAHELDPQKRPRTYAIVMMSLPNNSKGQQFADFISLNRYYGWYVMGGMCIVDAETAFRKEMDGWAQVLNGRPMIFTEYGADTMPSEHKLPSVMWSQEYQNEYLDMNHNVFDSYDFVQGELVWNFADFQTTEGIMRANGNKKGIFTRQRQPKDAAFHFRARWTSLPVDYKGNTAQF